MRTLSLALVALVALAGFAFAGASLVVAYFHR